MAEFQKGTSGNSKGRPKDKTPASQLRKSISDSMPEIIETLIKAAKDGDIQAAKALLDRVCPVLKAQASAVYLPVHNTTAGQASEVIRAVMQGEIAPDTGSMLINAIAAQVKIIETSELLARIEALEARK